MSRRPSQALQPWRWLGAPMLITILATLALDAPFRLFGFGLPEPVFPMVLAFAWGVIRPSLLAPILLLLLGLFQDLYWSGPLGLWALAFLAIYGLALTGRSLMAGQGAEVTAIWYVASVFLGLAIVYAFSTLKAHMAPSFLAAAWQFGWTAALFPLVYKLIDRFEDADIRFH